MARAGEDHNVLADLADAYGAIDRMDRDNAHPEDIIELVGIGTRDMDTDLIDSLASAIVATATVFKRAYADACDVVYAGDPDDDIVIVAKIRTEIINSLVTSIKAAYRCIGECALGVVLAYRNNKDLRDMEEAAESTIKSYLPHASLGKRLNVRVPRFLEDSFKEQAYCYDELLNPNSRGRRDRRDERRDRRSPPSRTMGGMGTATSDLRERRSGNRGGLELVNPAFQKQEEEKRMRRTLEEPRQERQPQQQPQPRPVPVQQALMTSITFKATDTCPHPPFYYNNGQKAMVTKEGIVFMNFDPASLALPEEHRPILTLAGLGSSSSGIRFAPAGASKPFELPVECVSGLDMTDVTRNVLNAARLSKGPGVVARLHCDLDVIIPKNTDQFKRFVDAILNKSQVSHMVQVMAEYHNRLTAGQCDISRDEYWFVNYRLTKAFRLASELMYGIDPMGIARIGTFGPTGHPDDNDDVASMIEIVDQHCGSTFAVRFGDKVGTLVKALAFAPYEIVMKSITDLTAQKGLAAGEHIMPSNFRVVADCNDQTPIVDLLANRWRPSGDGVPSPYGYAPCTISREATEMLHTLVTRLYAEFGQYNPTYATINFGPGQMLVARSAHNGEFVGQWVPF